MEQDIYNYVKELLEDIILFKNYKIDKMDDFCKKVAEKIPSEKTSLVMLGEMDEEIEDLIDEQYMLVKGNNKYTSNSNVEIIDASVRDSFGFQATDTGVKEDDVINYVVNILINSDYTFVNEDYPNMKNDINYLKHTAKSILKWHFSKEQYDDIILGEYDSQIFQLAIFRSLEFRNAKNKVFNCLKNNYYYREYSQLFNPKIIDNINSELAIVLLSAERQGINIDLNEIVNKALLKFIFPEGKKYAESFGDKVNNFMGNIKPSRDEVIAAGLLTVGIFTDIAIPMLITPIIYYKFKNGLKVNKSDVLEEYKNKSR